MSEVWFTSDTHFGHVSCATHWRQFTSTAEHDDLLVKNWNERVGKKDRVYHLGDVGLCKPQLLREILAGLNGQIYLIRGNHDKSAEHTSCRNRFVWIKDVFALKYAQQRLWLSHYAHLTWDRSHYGTWHLHGHSHGSLAEPSNCKRMDVGVDTCGFKPLHFTEIETVMLARTFQAVDHHTPERANAT